MTTLEIIAAVVTALVSALGFWLDHRRRAAVAEQLRSEATAKAAMKAVVVLRKELTDRDRKLQLVAAKLAANRPTADLAADLNRLWGK